jgi:phosphoribosylformylglycinamidine cyclo-ligase
LVRALMKKKPAILRQKIGRLTFLDAILQPHVCYYQAVKDLFGNTGLHGMAHITGGGIQGNLNRILPKGFDAEIDLAAIRILPIFDMIRRAGGVNDAEMLRTYNMGVGLTLVVDPSSANVIRKHMQSCGHDCYPIGMIAAGKQRVRYKGALHRQT